MEGCALFRISIERSVVDIFTAHYRSVVAPAGSDEENQQANHRDRLIDELPEEQREYLIMLANGIVRLANATR